MTESDLKMKILAKICDLLNISKRHLDKNGCRIMMYKSAIYIKDDKLAVRITRNHRDYRATMPLSDPESLTKKGLSSLLLKAYEQCITDENANAFTVGDYKFVISECKVKCMKTN